MALIRSECIPIPFETLQGGFLVHCSKACIYWQVSDTFLDNGEKKPWKQEVTSYAFKDTCWIR